MKRLFQMEYSIQSEEMEETLEQMVSGGSNLGLNGNARAALSGNSSNSYIITTGGTVFGVTIQ